MIQFSFYFFYFLTINKCKNTPHQTPLSFFGWSRSSAYVWTSLHSQHLWLKNYTMEERFSISFLLWSDQHAPTSCTNSPLQPEHWMKKLIRSKRATSLSCLYASIQSSTTDWKKKKHDWHFTTWFICAININRSTLRGSLYIIEKAMRNHFPITRAHSPVWHSSPF